MRPLPWSVLRRCSLAIVGLCGGLTAPDSEAETFSSLPPPPTLATTQDESQQYMLGLSVNQRESQQIVPVTFRHGHYWLRAADLQQAGIPAEKLSGPEVDVSAMPQVDVRYDSQRQRILLTVPSAWLPEQTFAGRDNTPRYPGRSSTGALLNYDVYSSHNSQAGSRLSAWNELRLFGAAGQFSSNGVWQEQLSGNSNTLNDGYIRYDTWWSYEDEDRILSWRVGDLVTDALSWSSSVRLGGIQLARDFSVRPDIVTWPLPSFAGQAAVPSTVDLFVNGYQTSSNQVQPGPWSMTNMPFVNGAGDAVVVTTDAVGRRVTTALPFYVSSDLLKPGLSDYAFSAGALRNNYGLKNFDYGTGAASGSWRYGATDWLTLETHAEGADRLALGGGGAQVKLGAFGVVNGALAQSRMKNDSGQQYSWGYQYNNSWFSLGTQHVIRSAGFADLALYTIRSSDVNDITWSLSRRSAQYNASVSLNHFGNLGAAFIDITSGSGDRTRLWNLSWSKNTWGNSSLYVAATRDVGSGEWSGAISLIIPFGEHGSASLNLERDAQGHDAQRVYLSRSMPSDGGFAWDASWANQSSGGDYRQGSLRWRNQKIDTSVGFYGDSDNSTEWADLAGSLVLMDHQLLAANEVNDAFVLVKTGYPNVTVRYENQAMGRTDRAGYLLVPRISSYYPAKYDIDALDLPPDMTASQVEQRFAVKRQSGYLLDFPVEPLRAASVILHDAQGNPLPVSSQVIRAGQPVQYVGWDGIAWLDDLKSENEMQVLTPDGRRCMTHLSLSQGRPEALKVYGPIVCVLPQAMHGAPDSVSANSTAGILP
ncbi:fimbria/pilus outer membrane usher protein [Mixta intestinalis]|uniref:F1 capsule-anchoring protein n=1 Tax=Mixta intestinalis TaxID=1615494 RepID=A0A6P1Q2G1_9GAMM|nr:fimbria/pilus outer membrane usher protein [Mixta intestinalis]QHM72414.1 F1 capsule-anchoring protein [Mixta intestinalis]